MIPRLHVSLVERDDETLLAVCQIRGGEVCDVVTNAYWDERTLYLSLREALIKHLRLAVRRLEVN